MNIFTRILIYYALYIVGFVLMLLLSVFRCKAYNISRVRALVYSFITFLSGLCGALIIGKIYNLIASLKDWYPDIKVDVLGAVIFTSLFLLAAVYIEKAILKRRQAAPADGKEKSVPKKTVSFRDTMDLMIPGSFLVFASIKLGCMFRGCCWGVECSPGVFSPYLQTTVFPIQIFESATIVAIVIGSYFIKQTRFYRRGMAGPLAAFLYGLARFFWEFFRWYSPETRHFFLGFTLWQIFCILVLIVAGIWLFVLYKTQPSEPMPKCKPQNAKNKWKNAKHSSGKTNHKRRNAKGRSKKRK